MKQDDKIRASLSKIQMPQYAKQRIWQSIAAVDEREAESMSKRSWIFAAGAAVLAAAVMAAALIPTAAPEQGGKAAQKTPDNAQQVAVVEPAITPTPDANKGTADATSLPREDDIREGSTDGRAGAGDDYETVASLKHVTLCDKMKGVSFPSSIGVLEEIPIEISETEMDTIEENLIVDGWQNIDMDGTDIDGLYGIWSRDVKGDVLDESEQHELRVQFLKVSGLLYVLEKKGMMLNLDESDHNGAIFSEVDGCRASGFVRLWFDKGKIVSDCKIWAVKSTLLTTADTVPLEEAVKDAFFVCSEGAHSDDSMEYMVIGAKLVYIGGIPIYELMLPIHGMRGVQYAYALAVDESVIMGSEFTKQAYEHFLETGF